MDYEQAFKSAYKRNTQANIKIGDLLNENEQMAEKIDELEKEVQYLRDANAINSYSNQMLQWEISKLKDVDVKNCIKLNQLEQEKQDLKKEIEELKKITSN